MSKEKKSANALRRKQERRSAKMARKALYQSYAEEGRKKGSRRAKSKKQVLVADHDHKTGICPNTGCHRCHPAQYNIPLGQKQLIARGLARWNQMMLKVIPT